MAENSARHLIETTYKRRCRRGKRKVDFRVDDSQTSFPQQRLQEWDERNRWLKKDRKRKTRKYWEPRLKDFPCRWSNRAPIFDLQTRSSFSPRSILERRFSYKSDLFAEFAIKFNVFTYDASYLSMANTNPACKMQQETHSRILTRYLTRNLIAKSSCEIFKCFTALYFHVVGGDAKVNRSAR